MQYESLDRRYCGLVYYMHGNMFWLVIF